MVRTRLSQCVRKRRFATAAAATEAAGAAGITLRPYRCDRCGRYHLTSRTKGKWAPLADGGSGGEDGGGGDQAG